MRNRSPLRAGRGDARQHMDAPHSAPTPEPLGLKPGDIGGPRGPAARGRRERAGARGGAARDADGTRHTFEDELGHVSFELLTCPKVLNTHRVGMSVSLRVNGKLMGSLDLIQDVAAADRSRGK